MRGRILTPRVLASRVMYKARKGSRFDWPKTRWKKTGTMTVFRKGDLNTSLEVVRLRAHGPYLPLTTIHVERGLFERDFAVIK